MAERHHERGNMTDDGDDALETVRALLADGTLRAQRTALAGDSAGGGLCVALLLRVQNSF